MNARDLGIISAVIVIVISIGVAAACIVTNSLNPAIYLILGLIFGSIINIGR